MCDGKGLIGDCFVIVCHALFCCSLSKLSHSESYLVSNSSYSSSLPLVSFSHGYQYTAVVTTISSRCSNCLSGEVDYM